MKKLRLLLAVAIATFGLNACAGSPTAFENEEPECNPEVQDCGIKPVTGN